VVKDKESAREREGEGEDEEEVKGDFKLFVVFFTGPGLGDLEEFALPGVEVTLPRRLPCLLLWALESGLLPSISSTPRRTSGGGVFFTRKGEWLLGRKDVVVIISPL